MKKIFILILFVFMLGCQPERSLHKRKVISLYNVSSYRGSFVLATGTIAQEDYYFFYVKRLDGGIVKLKIRDDRIIIYEGYNEPYLTWLSRAYSDEEVFFYDGWGSPEFKLYVPKNTIVRKIELK